MPHCERRFITMNRHTFSTLVLAAALVGAAAAADSTATWIGKSPNPGPQLAKVSGTWLWHSQPAPGIYMPALITYHLDGTITGADSAGGMPQSAIRTGPLHGVWVRTGANSIGGTSIMFLFDAYSGVLMAFARARSSLQFSDDSSQFQGKMFLERMPCPAGPPSCPDPLDPATMWMPWPGMPVDGFPVTGSRLLGLPSGPLRP